jgi:hypothetical protein
MPIHEPQPNPLIETRMREISNIYAGALEASRQPNNQNRKRSKNSIPRNLQGYSGLGSQLDDFGFDQDEQS